MKKLLFAIGITVCCNNAFNQTNEKSIVLNVEERTAEAFTKHNLNFLNTVFADNVTIISATGDVINKQQLLQSVQNVNSATVATMQVRIEGNVAVVTGMETETGRNNNSVYSNKMRFTDVLLKTKNQWQIITSQATAIQ